ncbi:hypothetical protein CKO40_00115 [Halochromatium glycolicum]|uniref:Uncharacterized protein n=2 Tax=Halochromatium glycolicum TaxID=85075 RepID=A0AAJ0X8H7_9GAMM|nr:hypothetical protein [Halochromatium glycolicum]
MICGLVGSSSAASLDIIPLWDGLFVAGAPVELQALVGSDTGGAARIVVTSDDYRLDYSFEIEAGEPLRLALPLRPGLSGRVKAAVELPDGSRLIESLTLTREPRAVTVTSSARLPLTGSGYGPIGRLVLTPSRLAALNGDQSAALAAYLARCGGLVVPGASAQGLALLRAAAGCGGAGIRANVSASLPTVQSVLLPAAPESNPQRSILLLLIPYLLFLLGVATLRRLGIWLLAVPAGAALVIAAALPAVTGGITASTIAVMHAGDTTMRWRAWLLADGGAGRERLPLASGTEVPRALDGGPVELVRSAEDATPALVLPTRLLHQRRFELAGIAPAPWSFRAHLTRDLVHLVNESNEVMPAGWLWTGDRALSLPPLAAGAGMEADIGSAVTAGGRRPDHDIPCPLEGLVDASGPALLLPLANEPLLGNQGWLIIELSPAIAEA